MKFESEDKARLAAVREVSRLLGLSPIDVRKNADRYFTITGNPEFGYTWSFRLRKSPFQELES